MSERIPRLPKSVYTGIVGEYVKLMAPLTEAPPEFLYAAFMASLGAGFPQVMFPWGDDHLPLTPYVLLVSKSGDRKTSAKHRAMETMHEALRGELFISKGTFTPEGAVRTLMEAANVNMDLADPLAIARDPAVIFDVGEFTGLLKASERGGNPLVELLLDGHSAPKNYSKTLSRSKDSTVLPRLRLAVIGDSTPEHLGKVMDQSHVHSGLFNRLDIFMGKRGAPVRRPLPVNHGLLIGRVIEPLRELQDHWTNDGPHIRAYAPIDLTKEADEFLESVYLEEIYPMGEDENAELFRRFDLKMNVYAVLHALNDASCEVTLTHMQQGYSVATHLRETALIAAGEIGRSDKAKLMDAIESHVRKAGPEGIKLRTLKQKIPKSTRDAQTKYGMAKVVDQMVDDGDLRYRGDLIVHEDFIGDAS